MKQFSIALLYLICSFGLKAQTESRFGDLFKTFYTTEYKGLLNLKNHCKKNNIKIKVNEQEEYTEVFYKDLILYYNYLTSRLEFLTYETNTSIKDVVAFYEAKDFRVLFINNDGLYYMVSRENFSISIEKGSKKTTSVSLQNDNLE